MAMKAYLFDMTLHVSLGKGSLDGDISRRTSLHSLLGLSRNSVPTSKAETTHRFLGSSQRALYSTYLDAHGEPMDAC